MVAGNLVLIAGAGGTGRTVLDQLRAQDVPVRAMVRRDDERAAQLRALGADVVVGDLTRPEDVAAALEGVGRMYFTMPVSPDHLLAATVVATVARERGGLNALVGMSQMAVSEMTATGTGKAAESHQHRLHWLAEQVLEWSGLPVVHIRPTVFMERSTAGQPPADAGRVLNGRALFSGDGGAAVPRWSRRTLPALSGR